MKVVLQHHAGSEAGSALLSSVLFSSLMVIAIGSLATLSSFGLREETGRIQWTQAYYHTENALQWASQKIAAELSGGTNAPFLGTYSFSGGTLTVPYFTAASGQGSLNNAWVQISNDPGGVENLYRVVTSAKVGDKVRTLQATVKKNPPSVIFDYEYFLNNWGWWWGNSITGEGDNRANWDFDFRHNPTVNGGVLANGDIASNGVAVDPFSSAPPFAGKAATDLFAYVHSGAPRVNMPNLKDFDYYAAKAVAANGQLWLGTNLLVSAVHTNAVQPGLYLEGTAAVPIRIEGPVVIPGDVVIKGVMTGTGTFYVGGHLYVAGNLTYLNGPSFATPPESSPPAVRDAWVADAVANNKDLVAFAVRESIFGGAPNSAHWKYWEFDAGTWGLVGLGDEGTLGEDGIRFTPDDNVAYRDTNGDGTLDSAWFDADGDGVIDAKYHYDNDIKMTATRAGKIFQYPVDGMGAPLDFDTLSSNSMNRLDGVYYCNHAVAMRLGSSHSVWNGGLICRDEAIVFTSSLKINYDPRVHSRYSPDPNRHIDLGLPVSNRAMVMRMEEIAPTTVF